MRAIRAAGLRIPADVSVVGFDDVDLAAYVDPPLTTISQSTAEMGHWAVDRLTRELADRQAARGAGGEVGAEAEVGPEAEQGVDHVMLPVRLVVRGSSGPPRS
jgi:LacI family transcriptional regulator